MDAHYGTLRIFSIGCGCPRCLQTEVSRVHDRVYGDAVITLGDVEIFYTVLWRLLLVRPAPVDRDTSTAFIDEYLSCVLYAMDISFLHCLPHPALIFIKLTTYNYLCFFFVNGCKNLQGRVLFHDAKNRAWKIFIASLFHRRIAFVFSYHWNFHQ